MLFRWCSLSRLLPQGAAILQLAWVCTMAEAGHQYSLCWFFHTSPALLALRVFKHHLSLVSSPPHSAPLDVPSPQIHFIDFEHHPVFFTSFPPAHLFRHTIHSS